VKENQPKRSPVADIKEAKGLDLKKCIIKITAWQILVAYLEENAAII